MPASGMGTVVTPVRISFIPMITIVIKDNPLFVFWAVRGN